MLAMLAEATVPERWRRCRSGRRGWFDGAVVGRAVRPHRAERERAVAAEAAVVPAVVLQPRSPGDPETVPPIEYVAEAVVVAVAVLENGPWLPAASSARTW